MKKFLKIEYFLAVIYIVIMSAVCVAAFGFGLAENITVPVFIGLFGVAPFVFFFGAAHRIAPRLSKIFLAIFGFVTILFFIPALKFSFCLPIPLLIVFMFLINRERRLGFERWLKTNKFSPVPNPPPNIFETLGKEKYWQCYANSFFPAAGREVPYLIWFGTSYTPSTIMVNGIAQQTKLQVSHTAISFFPQTVSEKFKAKIDASNAEKQSFWENLKPHSQKTHPYQTAHLPDGSFVAAWIILHVPSILDEKLSEVKSLLENSF